VRVQLESGEVEWEPEEFLSAFRDGRVPALTNVSFDYGKTWTTAAAAAKRIEQKAIGTEALGTFVPKGWDYYAAYSLWFGLFWGFGFAVPGTFLGAYFAHRHNSSPLEAFLAMSAAFVTGPAVMFALGFVVRWSVRRTNRRGAGVAWFCFFMGALTTLELLAFSRL
jgi:hypothetical protein